MIPACRKIVTADLARDWADGLDVVKRVVFTNGCFDVLHPGHLWSLYNARQLGDYLVVGLNSDESVKRLKGPGRPLQAEWHRAAVLACLEFVDKVVIFGEDTPEDLIRAITPDILVKGADWKGKEVAGADWVIFHGGRVEYISTLDGFSTTEWMRKVTGGA
jgi:D-beta-D-heptose 7-phosphate kinase/D-beta-D-heptose 1-phosphate adenosyltransferase